MGAYGRGFKLKDPSDNGLYAPAINGIDAGPYLRSIGFWGYNEFCEKMQSERPEWTFVRVKQIPLYFNFKNYWFQVLVQKLPSKDPLTPDCKAKSARHFTP